jgi:lipopolysaccharide transport system permease protein
MAEALGGTRITRLSPRADPRSDWWRELRRHADVLLVLARKDFQTRYKRAAFGVLWAVAVPVLQATIMAIVFSRVVRSGAGAGYGIFVMSGIIPFSYFSSALLPAVTSIVEGSSLTDKVWFPRLLLVIVPVLSNIVGLVVTLLVMVAAMPILGVHYSIRLLLLIPAGLLLIGLVTSVSMVASALHVYFRDVKFIVQAALMIWLYVTPIIYPISFLGRLSAFVDANPLTGVVQLFHMATVGSRGPWLVPLIVSLGVTAFLLVVGTEAQRRYDRLFVDLL